MNMTDLTVSGFIDELASGSPVPGGGSVSALAAALAAALVSMVGSLTLRRLSSGATERNSGELEGQPQGEAENAEADLAMAADIASDLRRHLTRLIDEDAEAFKAVMAAYRLPRSSDEERLARSTAIQAALKRACQAPSEVARAAVEVLRLSEVVARRGIPAALSDAAVACLVAHAALGGACLNARINLKSIKDDAFVSRTRADMDRAIASGRAIRERVMAFVEDRL